MFLHWRMRLSIAGNANVTAAQFSIKFHLTFIALLLFNSEVLFVVRTLSRLESTFMAVAALLQGCLCNAVVCACDDAAMRVCSYLRVTASYTTWQIGHTTLHSHAVRARDRPSSVFKTSASDLGLQPRLTDRRILRPRQNQLHRSGRVKLIPTGPKEV